MSFTLGLAKCFSVLICLFRCHVVFFDLAVVEAHDSVEVHGLAVVFDSDFAFSLETVVVVAD